VRVPSRYLDRIELTNSNTGALTILNYKGSFNTDWNSSTYVYPQSSYTFKATLYTSGGDDFDGDLYLTPGNWWSTGSEFKAEGITVMESGSKEFTFKLSDTSFISTLGVRIVSLPSSL